MVQWCGSSRSRRYETQRRLKRDQSGRSTGRNIPDPALRRKQNKPSCRAGGFRGGKALCRVYRHARRGNKGVDAMSRKPITIKIRSGAELIQAAHDHNARVAAWYAKKPLLG